MGLALLLATRKGTLFLMNFFSFENSTMYSNVQHIAKLIEYATFKGGKDGQTSIMIKTILRLPSVKAESGYPVPPSIFVLPKGCGLNGEPRRAGRGLASDEVVAINAARIAGKSFS